MKTVGIVTWFGTRNHGSNLQAIGLASVIESNGYEAVFIDKFKVPGFLIRHPSLLFARVLNRFNQKKKRAFFTPVPYRISEERTARIKRFREENFKSRSFLNASEWKKAIEDRMIFVVGSDIIWNPAKGYPAMNFLDFAYYAKLPRFSYASSIGAPELPQQYYHAYRKYLGNMEAVGVREQAAAEMLEPIIGRKVTQVLDPSMLLTAEDWDRLEKKACLSVEISSHGYILCYFVMHDPRYWEYIKRVKAVMNLQVIVLPMHELDEQQPYNILRDRTPYEFVWLVKHARFICTDSFHACALSLIYEKEFYLLRRARKSEDAKYDDFLNRYHLTDREVRDETVFKKKPVDYRFAKEQLAKDRAFSLAFLKDALQACEK